MCSQVEPEIPGIPGVWDPRKAPGKGQKFPRSKPGLWFPRNFPGSRVTTLVRYMADPGVFPWFFPGCIVGGVVAPWLWEIKFRKFAACTTRSEKRNSAQDRRTGGSSGGVRHISSSTTNLRARSSSLERPFDACSDSGCHKNIPDVTDGGFDR